MLAFQLEPPSACAASAWCSRVAAPELCGTLRVDWPAPLPASTMVQESVDVRNANSAIRQSAAALPSTLQGSRIPPACSSSASAPIRRFRRYQLRAANSCTPAEGSPSKAIDEERHA